MQKSGQQPRAWQGDHKVLAIGDGQAGQPYSPVREFTLHRPPEIPDLTAEFTLHRPPEIPDLTAEFDVLEEQKALHCVDTHSTPVSAALQDMDLFFSERNHSYRVGHADLFDRNVSFESRRP